MRGTPCSYAPPLSQSHMTSTSFHRWWTWWWHSRRQWTSSSNGSADRHPPSPTQWSLTTKPLLPQLDPWWPQIGPKVNQKVQIQISVSFLKKKESIKLQISDLSVIEIQQVSNSSARLLCRCAMWSSTDMHNDLYALLSLLPLSSLSIFFSFFFFSFYTPETEQVFFSSRSGSNGHPSLLMTLHCVCLLQFTYIFQKVDRLITFDTIHEQIWTNYMMNLTFLAISEKVFRMKILQPYW